MAMALPKVTHPKDVKMMEKLGWWGCAGLLVFVLAVTFSAWWLRHGEKPDPARAEEVRAMNAVVPTAQQKILN
jgi:hypothetical protein